MKWKNNDSENGYHRMQVEAEWEEVTADYEDIVEGYLRIPIAGFRAGRAPRQVVEKRFYQKIMGEFSRRCGWRLAREALQQAGAESLGSVELRDIQCVKEKPFQFTVRFWPMPETELPDFSALSIRDDSSDPCDQISRRLLELVSFDIPDELVRTELDPDNGHTGRESAEWKDAADRVRLMLILKKIAKKEGIGVTEADVEQRIHEKAIEFASTPDALRAELKKGGGRQRLKDMLLAESTLDYLVERNNR